MNLIDDSQNKGKVHGPKGNFIVGPPPPRIKGGGGWGGGLQGWGCGTF